MASVVIAAALVAIAVVQVWRLVLAVRVARSAERARPVPWQRPLTVHIPQLCGRSVRYAGLTDTCGRRAGHSSGRCMTDAEIVSVLEGDTTHTVVPCIGDSDMRVDVAALGRHMDDCPSRLFDDGALHHVEVEWLIRTRLMTEALVSGERFSEWGETRG